jgi:hypothetical protein
MKSAGSGCGHPQNIAFTFTSLVSKILHAEHIISKNFTRGWFLWLHDVLS